MLRGNPLGLRTRIVTERKTIQLSPGQTLFSVTDGYLEGSRNLRKLVRNLEVEKRKKIDLDYLTGLLATIQTPEDLEDDRSIITIQVREPKAS